MSVVHLYAKEYGWTRDYILDNVYVDEHFLLQEMIEEDRRIDLLIQSNISLLPHTEDKARKKFFESLEKPEQPLIEVKETDFKAIERAKEMLANM